MADECTNDFRDLPSARGRAARDGGGSGPRCRPRQVVTGKGSAEYVDAARFFVNTYPTRGLRNLLADVCRRLSGARGERPRPRERRS